MERMEQLERKIMELENKLCSMNLNVMQLEARLTNYKLDNINMGLSLSNQITATKIKN